VQRNASKIGNIFSELIKIVAACNGPSFGLESKALFGFEKPTDPSSSITGKL